MAKIIGIDLGTTNSVVAVMEGGEPKVIPNRRVTAPRRRSWRLPRAANGWSARWPNGRRLPTRENTIYSIKRFMGRRFNEVSDEMKMVPYKVKAQGDHVVVEAQGKDIPRPRSRR